MSGSGASALRVGLIGAGDIGELRARALGRTPGLELVAVADEVAARAERLAAAHGARAEADWRRLAAADGVDAVIVSTPPSVHAEMCVAALAAGKHVLCEKPLARDPGECARILAAEERSGATLATGFNYRFFPSMATARAWLDDGLIGELDHIRGYTGYTADAHSQAWMHDAETMGGGALRDNGIHLIDLVCDFLGDLAGADGLASGGVWGYPGCEDNGFLLLRNGAGKVAALQASWTEWRGYRMLVEIYGRRGCIRASCFPMWVTATFGDAPGGRRRRRRRLFPATHLMEHLRSYRWVVVESFRHELTAFAAAVAGEPSRVASGRDGARAIEAAAAARPTADRAAP